MRFKYCPSIWYILLTLILMLLFIWMIIKAIILIFETPWTIPIVVIGLLVLYSYDAKAMTS